MPEQLPQWNAVGVEPPQSLKDSGWQPGMRPSAQHMNWLLNRAYKCIEELQQAGGNVDDLTQAVASLEQTVGTHLNDNLSHTKWIETIGGTANALTATIDGLTSYKNGLAVSFPATSNSTAAVTLNINSLGAIPIKKANGTAVTNLKAGGVYTLRYRGSAFILQGEGGAGNAQPSDVRVGKTFTNDDGEKTGTLVAYSVGETVTAKNLIDRDYIQVDQRVKANDTKGDYLNSEVATINGVEYAFSYGVVNLQGNDYSFMTCVETLTGRILWSKSGNYYWQGRIVVVGDKLYIGYKDRAGALTTGNGLQILNALTSANISATKFSNRDGVYVNDIKDICYNSTYQEIIVMGGDSTNYLYIGRYDLSGKELYVSENLYNRYLSSEGENPLLIQSTSSNVYAASSKCVYYFDRAFNYYGKTTPLDTYTILGLALNNIGGVTYLERGGWLNVLLGVTPTSRISVGGTSTSGLTIKGTLLGYASPTHLFTYRISADGKLVVTTGSLIVTTDIGDTYYNASKCIGMSENALVAPKYQSKDFPPVFTKTLKVIR